MKRLLFSIATGFILIALACGGFIYYNSADEKPLASSQTKTSERKIAKTNGVLKSAVFADRPAYTTLKDLKDHAEIVVLGTVQKQIKTYNLSRDAQDPTKENTEFPVMGTDYAIAVDKYIKGNGESSIVMTMEGTEDRTPMQIGSKYILFLNNVSGKYMFGGEPFKFKVADGKVLVDSNDKGSQANFKAMSEQVFSAELQK